MAAQQADLAELLAQNNIYAPSGGTLTVSNQAELDFATALGDKVSIINGAVAITQTATMDAAQLGTLMAKMASVTGAVAYTATNSTTTSQSFSNLTGALSVNLNQTGDISMPKLATTGALTLAGDTKTTSVSFPALTSAASGLSALSFSKATTVSFPVLATYDGAISITTDNDATVDLSALTSAAATVGYTTIDALTVVNASVLTAPMFDKGAITANKVASVSLPKWEGTAASSFAKAKTAVLPAISATKTANLTFDVDTILPEATSVHVIGKSVAGTTVTYEVSVTTEGQDNLETLILGGVFDAITIKDNTDLVTLTFDASAEDVTIDNTDLVNASIALTAVAAATSTTSKPTLTVQNNDAMNSFTASDVNNLKGLKVYNNRNLKTVSFADLDTAAAAATVTITDNDFSGTVTYSNTTATAGALASTSGLKELKSFLDSAISGRTGTVAMQVELDDATTVSSTGVESTPSSTYYIVDLINAVTSGGDDAVARQIAHSVKTTGAGNIQVMIGSDALYVDSSNSPTAITPSANIALAISELKSSAAVSRAAALGLTLDVVEGGNVQAVNIVFAAALNSATGETTLATTSTTLIGADDYATLSIGSQSVTATSGTSTASATDGIASALAAAWLSKYGTASTLYDVDGDTTSGTIAISVSAGSGNRAHNDAVDVSYTAGTDTSTTPLLDFVIGATNATTDNKLKGDSVIILLENATAGVTGVTSPTVSFSGTLTVSNTLTSTDVHTTATAISAANGVYRTEGRGLAVNAWDGTTLVVTTTAATTDRTAFL
ncbi:hypothetical protein OAC73_01415 [Flavobacteriaceae bacterium]|nr:hypothetical protein [Flavobacteriaceae bacterium]